jgi:ferredoxin
MLYPWLKKLRVFISLLFFLVITLLFLDFTGNLFHEAALFTTHLQFVPSLILFIGTGSGIALGFLLILVLTFLFGRIYCSTLCPMGTLQDVFIFLYRKLSPKKVLFKFKKPHNLFRYAVLSLVLLSLLTGSLILVNLTDPFSMYGKLAHNLFLPVAILVNNVAAKAHTLLKLYILFPVKWVPVNIAALLVALAWGLMVLILSVKRGRLYCNTVCPLGALLGLAAKISIFRIRLDKTLCNSCGKCSAVCKAQCIDPRDQNLDFSRCVGCMNCLSPCPDKGVKIVPIWKKDELQLTGHDSSRRKFIGESSLLLAATLTTEPDLFGQDTVKEGKKEIYPGTVPVFREHPVTPPGSFGRERFNQLCTACHLCVSACPTMVLQPTWIHYGLHGFLQPRMDYITSFCNYECTLCGQVCPTGAIRELPVEEKKLVQMGKAKFVKDNCIVYTRNTACGACSEHCPTKAVNMIPYKDKLTIPEVTDNICIGCGACEYACPTDPKAIYVDGNPLHLLAEKPKEEKLDEKLDYKEEFPF